MGLGDPSRCSDGTHSYSVPKVNTSRGAERNKAKTHLKTHQPNSSLGRVTMKRRLYGALINHGLSGLVAKIRFGPFDCLLSLTCGRINACQSMQYPAFSARPAMNSEDTYCMLWAGCLLINAHTAMLVAA